MTLYKETMEARRTLYIWAISINIVALGVYLYLTKVMHIDFELIRQARLSD